MSRPGAEHALVRIMDGRHVEAVFHHVGGRWGERTHSSKAQSRFMYRRLKELGDLSDEEQAVIFRRDDGGSRHPSQGRSHRVKLIGNQPFSKAYRSEWNGVPLHDIPGYREVYRLGRYTFRPGTLFRMLDVLSERGITEVQLDTLRRYARS